MQSLICEHIVRSLVHLLKPDLFAGTPALVSVALIQVDLRAQRLVLHLSVQLVGFSQ